MAYLKAAYTDTVEIGTLIPTDLERYVDYMGTTKYYFYQTTLDRYVYYPFVGFDYHSCN